MWNSAHSQWYCSPVAYFTDEVNPSLAKPQLKFNGDLAKLELTTLVREVTGDQLVSAYNLALTMVFMSCSSLMARLRSPLILSLPPMNACVGFSSPENIFWKSSLFMVMVHPADPLGGAPIPQSPPSAFRSRYHWSPSRTQNKTHHRWEHTRGWLNSLAPGWCSSNF